MIRDRFLLKVLIALCLSLVSFIGCGGGSSGTGEDASYGQIVDTSCQPVSGVDMSGFGVQGVPEKSGSDGSFRFDPNLPMNDSILVGNSVIMIDTSVPTCALFIVDKDAIVHVVTYPLDELDSCSVINIKKVFPGDLGGFCGE